ncbi:MAG TPA: UDP-N-acetylmuramate--L-alanine ligase [Bacteroidales bacterium]|nr:UDP-N-acetylmuramate--L-alanine ligase [Bacteroidales bacterium]
MKTYYFLGIGGIGMSAIARYMKDLGNRVYGYDRISSPLTLELEKEGMIIVYSDDVSTIPTDIDLVIYTPAVSHDNKIYKHFIENNFKMEKRSQILGEITKGKKCIAIAGSHGKTTCSTMIAHILHNSSVGCSAFLGGISNNFDSNYVVNKNSGYVVVEADEYDRSFLQLNPMISAITAMDADHLDVYGTYQEMQKSFLEFANKTREVLFLKKGVDMQLSECNPANVLTYTIRGVEADYYAINIRNYKGGYYFDLRTPDKIYYDIALNYGGVHNVENAVMAIGIAMICGVTEEEMRQSVASFSGVKRRFEVIINGKDLVYIDDYAHHPNEIKALVESLRFQYPNKKLTAVFQPHLYTRTRDFADEFAKELNGFDEVVLLDIYPAREEPIKGIDSKMLLHKIDNMNRYYSTKEMLFDLLEALYPEVLVTIGAGDISELVPSIAERFKDE